MLCSSRPIRRGEDSIIAGIEEKIAEWTHLPPENGEPIQVLRYVDGQKYDAHVSEWALHTDMRRPSRVPTCRCMKPRPGLTAHSCSYSPVLSGNGLMTRCTTLAGYLPNLPLQPVVPPSSPLQWDWFDDVHHKDNSKDGNRYCTVLLYLGGEFHDLKDGNR